MNTPPPKPNPAAGPQERAEASPAKPLAERLLDQLPQTQCRRCGFEGCRPYAEALAKGETGLNRCPPGGDAGIQVLASILKQPPLPLDPSCGQTSPFELATIDEGRCIGCALCIAACPVDAIVGAFKQMHTVISEDCTGCALCLPPCPVDCIVMSRPSPPRDWTQADAVRARAQHEAQLSRRAQPQLSVQEDKRRRLLEAARARARSSARVPDMVSGSPLPGGEA